jgi:hypothetical protein
MIGNRYEACILEKFKNNIRAFSYQAQVLLISNKNMFGGSVCVDRPFEYEIQIIPVGMT